MVCFWLTVLLCNRRGLFKSERGLGESVVVREDALIRTASISRECGETALVVVEVFMGEPDRKIGMTVCVVVSGSSRKDMEETTVLKEQFGSYRLREPEKKKTRTNNVSGLQMCLPSWAQRMREARCWQLVAMQLWYVVIFELLGPSLKWKLGPP